MTSCWFIPDFPLEAQRGTAAGPTLANMKEKKWQLPWIEKLHWKNCPPPQVPSIGRMFYCLVPSYHWCRHTKTVSKRKTGSQDYAWPLTKIPNWSCSAQWSMLTWIVPLISPIRRRTPWRTIHLRRERRRAAIVKQPRSCKCLLSQVADSAVS